jgi:2'-hydroxyisoflavone reductase
MRLLILGGTQFLGRAIANHACASGADVVCAARGVSGAVPTGARLVQVDRDQADGLAPLKGERFDAVVDVSRQPGQVRRALAALRDRADHWTYVSTVSVYSDTATVGQCTGTAPLHQPTGPDVEHATPETYGPAKRACELAVGADAFICRAGLIAGPEDPTGRFTYWPLRLARGGDVLVPGRPSDLMQLIDVRDLALWIVHAAETKLTGTIDAVSPTFTCQDFLTACQDAAGSTGTFRWAERAFLEAQGVKRWSGPRSLPLWVPLPEFAGFMTRDASPAIAQGLTLRPLVETARDTLVWAQSIGGGPKTGLTPDEERDVLAALDD